MYLCQIAPEEAISQATQAPQSLSTILLSHQLSFKQMLDAGTGDATGP